MLIIRAKDVCEKNKIYKNYILTHLNYYLYNEVHKESKIVNFYNYE
jgi:hypothetical protein